MKTYETMKLEIELRYLKGLLRLKEEVFSRNSSLETSTGIYFLEGFDAEKDFFEISYIKEDITRLEKLLEKELHEKGKFQF